MAPATGVEARYANHAIASVGPTEVVLTFGQVIPPAITNDEERAAFLNVDALEANVVSHLAMPHAKFVQMVESFSTLIARLQAQGLLLGETDEEDDNDG